MAPYDKKQAFSDLRVGIITFIGLVCLVLGITFAGGDKGLLFKKTSLIKAQLIDVGGLKKGASVTMNGMGVGKVTNITFVKGQNNLEVSPRDNPPQIEVTLEVRSEVRKRIKMDSVPVIRTQGMLGDRYIEIPSGSENSEVLPDGKVLIGAAAGDFDRTLKEALEVMSETQKLLKAINAAQGTAGKFVYDEKFYNNLTLMTDQMNDLIQDFKKNPRRYIKFSLF